MRHDTCRRNALRNEAIVRPPSTFSFDFLDVRDHSGGVAALDAPCPEDIL